MTPIEKALEYKAYTKAVSDFEQLCSHYQIIPVSEFANKVWGGTYGKYSSHSYPDVHAYSAFMAYRELARRRLANKNALEVFQGFCNASDGLIGVHSVS